MGTATLIFAIVAALAASAVAVWEWIDRPRYAWRVTINRTLTKPERLDNGTITNVPISSDERHRADVSVHAIGTGVAYDVTLRLVGMRQVGVERLWDARMATGTEPIETRVAIPPAEKGCVRVEIFWTTMRGRREYGERVDLRSLRYERWRWQWRSLRLRDRSGRRDGPLLKRWLRRTGGRWVPFRMSRVHVPVTEPDRMGYPLPPASQPTAG